MSNTKENISPNHKYKDRLFTMIFGDKTNKQNILSLYNAIYSTNYTNEDDVEITTLEDALYMNMKNDVSFLLDCYLTLWEHQSTFNPNMPVRGLMYYGNLYNSYINRRRINIYSSALKKLPTPKYVVFYNGTDDLEPIKKLKLSEAFIHEDSDHEFEWTATMINLNADKNSELLEKCKPLADYTTFVNMVKYYKDLDYMLEDAIDVTINYCIENDILADFLRKHRSDVMNTCLTEFDEEAYKKDLLEEGRIAGLKEASFQYAKEFFSNGASYELVRKSINGLTDEELQKIYAEVSEHQLNE